MRTVIARKIEDVDAAISIFSKCDVLGCDTETSGLNPKHGKLLSIQFSDGDLSVLLPLSEGVEMGEFSDLLSDERIVKIFHNAKFDLEFLREDGFSVRNVFDTMIAEKVLTRGARQSASLADTLYRYFAVDLDKSQRAKFTRKWDGIWTEDLVDYALSDVVHLPALMREQSAWLDKLALTSQYEELIRPLLAAAEPDSARYAGDDAPRGRS